MLQRTRGERCASDLLLDQWVSGELSADAVASAEAHVATCARCSDRLATIRSAREAFSTKLPLELARATRVSPAKRRWQRWGPRVAGVLALAAALLLFVRTRPPSGDAVEKSERIKGGSRVSFHVRHGEIVRSGTDDDRLVAGDAIEFSYSSREGGYLAIFSIDGAQHASVYYADGKRAARIEPGTDSVLSQSTVLDATLGVETIYALFCDEPVPVEPIRAALQADPTKIPSVRGCAVDKHVFVKVPL